MVLSSGELEETLLESFCSFANLRGLLKSINCPNALKKCLPIIEKYLAPRRNGTLAADVAALDYDWLAYISGHDDTMELSRIDQRICDIATEPSTVLDPELLNIMKPYILSPQPSTCRKTRTHPRFNLAGVQYSRSSANHRECCVFYLPRESATEDTALIPGLIRQIVSVISCPDASTPEKSIETFYFIVQRFKALDAATRASINFPLSRSGLEDFRASLWSQEMVDGVEVLTLTGKICQGIYRPWSHTAFVMRALDKVGFN